MSRQVRSEITGMVWKVETQSGAVVEAGDVILIIESMKMEIPVEAPHGGLCRVLVSEGQTIQDGELLATIE
jgi:acetyl-CoA carboxylase biotin carboxyl carrier protein